MNVHDPSYYAEILILVDGWPWNLSEFDFRRWFAPGACPAALDPVEIATKTARAAEVAQVSGNRRVPRRKNKKAARRKAA